MCSLTILASGDSRLWLCSRPPGDTCWSTDWLVTMPLLLWWLMLEEEAASPGPWLYRTEKEGKTRQKGCVSPLLFIVCCTHYRYVGQEDARPSKTPLSRHPNQPDSPPLWLRQRRGQTNTHWPVHCCYLRSPAKAIYHVHAVTTAKLPTGSLVITQTLVMTSPMASTIQTPSVKMWRKTHPVWKALCLTFVQRRKRYN